MKMSKILSIVLVVVMLATALTSCEFIENILGLGKKCEEHIDVNMDGKCDNCDEVYAQSVDLTGTYEVTLWVSELAGVTDLTASQIDAFEAANPGIVINAAIEGVTEADAASKVVADVASAPDIFCFAQDQLARLVQASALAAPGKVAQNTIKAYNDGGSVAAASVAGTIYAYPMTSDNGYYLYYDTSIVTNPDSLEDIIRDCTANGKKFRYALENAWYTASFFFATDCHSTWTMTQDGEFNGIDDDFNSAAGLAAMKGMQKLAQSSCYDSDADSFTDAAAIVTGTWNAPAALEHFGANLGAADLPSFTVDGQTYHLGSFSGNKLMGVKPQADAKKAAVLSRLAQWLTNEECQQARFEQFGWGPSNKVVQSSDAVKADLSLSAFAAQSEYAIPQGQIHGSWWDIAKVLGAEAKAATSDADLQTALDEYDAAIEAVLSMSDDDKAKWGVIGSICGTSWDTDFTMTQVSEGVYESEPLELNEGDEFKVRQGGSWDLNIGSDGNHNGPNFVVETTGTYIVRLEWTEGTTTGVVTLVPVE